MCVRFVCKHAYGVPVSTSGVIPRSQSTSIFLGQRVVETDWFDWTVAFELQECTCAPPSLEPIDVLKL